MTLPPATVSGSAVTHAQALYVNCYCVADFLHRGKERKKHRG